MTGIGMAAASAASVAAAQPLTADLIWTGSDSNNVSGASGSLSPSGGVNLFSATVSGGTGPYTTALIVENDPSGKLAIVTSGDGVHATLGWSGFSLNETESCNARWNVTDSLGATATARYPTAGSILIQRTS